jgi:hypothetical protein
VNNKPSHYFPKRFTSYEDYKAYLRLRYASGETKKRPRKTPEQRAEEYAKNREKYALNSDRRKHIAERIKQQRANDPTFLARQRVYQKHLLAENPEYRKRRNEYSRDNRPARALEWKEWFFDYKKNLACMECGANHPAVLDFHHTDPSQKIADIAKMVAQLLSKDTIKKEIDKCVVLCANCHRVQHWNLRYQLEDAS